MNNFVFKLLSLVKMGLCIPRNITCYRIQLFEKKKIIASIIAYNGCYKNASYICIWMH